MRSILFACLGCLLAVTLLPVSLPAQTHEPAPLAEGKLKGLVLDPNEARIVGAKITLENKRYKVEVWTNDEGAFEVRLPAGEYKLTIENDGFTNYVRKRVRIEADKTETIKPTLSPAGPVDLLKIDRVK